jgi:hypothetical protein
LHGAEEFSIRSSTLGSGKVIPEVVARTVSSISEEFRYVRHTKCLVLHTTCKEQCIPDREALNKTILSLFTGIYKEPYLFLSPSHQKIPKVIPNSKITLFK